MAMLDSSRRVFINENCFREEKMQVCVQGKLEKMGFSKDNIVRGVDLDLMRDGDYKIRCVESEPVVFEIGFQKENIILKKIGSL